MNKDVIYIDTEDDITAIVGKIKDSKEKIIALVPPKRIGILQSAVNLKLLARCAETSSKHLVLVTNNKALIALSATAEIPVARNLQSKPEMAEIDALEIDDGEDIIEGSRLPIGELVKTTDHTKDDEVEEVISTIDIENEAPKLSRNLPKNDIRIPDFSRFRRRLFVGIFAAIMLGVFLFWAITIAPSAKIIITAQTSPAPVSLSAKLGGTAATDISKGIIQTVTKQIQKDVSVPFTATGKKDVGDKAAGIITIENCGKTSAFVIATNTVFTAASGEDFISSSAAEVPGFSGDVSECQASGAGAGVKDIPVTAENPGGSYNLSATGYSYPNMSKYIYANGSAMAGGTTKVSTVVTADDVQKASQALVDLSSDSVKQQLISQFTNGEYVIKDSFNVAHAAAVPSPAVGAESTSSATLTSRTTFSIIAIAKSEIEPFLKDAINKQITDSSQRIYSDGIDGVELSGYSSTDQGATVNINIKKGKEAQIGPNIDQASIKQQIRGKQFGDAQAIISEIKGVDNVDIKFSYFWVNTVPNDVNKIDVEFKIQNA